MRLKVGVIFGGDSAEHDVSIKTFLHIKNDFNEKKYEIVPIYLTHQDVWYTGALDLFTLENFQDKKILLENLTEVSLIKKQESFVLVKRKGLFKKKITTLDLVMPLTHGPHLEDGTLTGYFKTLKIPYVGSGVLPSALSQDKAITKQILQSYKIPIVNFLWFYESDYKAKKESILASITKLGYPVVVKPANLGSSIGTSYVLKAREIESAIQNAFFYDEKVVIEEVVEHLSEVSCAIYGNHEIMEISEFGSISSSNAILTFEDKAKEKVNLIELDKKIKEEMTNIAKQVFYLFDLKGIVKFDFFINDESKQVYLNEINPIPTDLAKDYFQNISFEKILDQILSMAIKDHKINKKKVTTYKSNILKKED